MYRYEKENWVRKVKDSYPKQWSTTYGDLNLNAGRHYVHDLGHDPHYVYDREPDSYYTDPDGYRHHHYEMTTRSAVARTARRRHSVVDHTRTHSRDRQQSPRRLATDRDYQRRRRSPDDDHPRSDRDHQQRGSLTRQNSHFTGVYGNGNCTCHHSQCNCRSMMTSRDDIKSARSRPSRSHSVKVKLPPLHPSNQSTRLAAEIQHQFRRRPSTSRQHKPGVNEKFLGFKYLGHWKPNKTGLGYSIR